MRRLSCGLIRKLASPLRKLSLITILGCALAFPAGAGEVTVAVASNFASTAAKLGRAFEADSGHRVRLVRGSTGKLYAQVVNGAPFDVFLAADAERPGRLEDDGLAVPGSRRTYAIGRLVAWSRDPLLAGRDCLAALRDPDPGRIALANPDLAPYGAAARAYLESAGLWDALSARAVYGENVAQALQFTVSGGARIGFIAASQLATPGLPGATCHSEVPADTHAPIEQQGVLVERASGNAAAKLFFEWLATPAARQIIADAGYRIAGE